MKPVASLCLAAVFAMSAGAAWSADGSGKPTYEARTELAQRRFGDLHFVMGAGRAMQWLEMYSGQTLLAALRDFAVEEIVASPDGKYFLALSNSSDSSLAFAVLDRKGHVVASSPHGGELRYCRRTNWGIGEWVDASSPQATFQMEKNQLASPATEFLTVAVRGCDGKTVLLGRIPPPDRRIPAPAKAADCASNAQPPAAADQGGAFFIGTTIACLRGLDPTFGARTLTLIDGRRAVRPPSTPAPDGTAPAATNPDQ